MTVQRLLPVIALFRFDLHFGNDCIEKKILSNHRKTEKSLAQVR